MCKNMGKTKQKKETDMKKDGQNESQMGEREREKRHLSEGENFI